MNLIKKLYAKEGIRYLVWGVISMVINIALFWGLSKVMDYVIANIITLTFNRVFCFFTNKSYVFITPYGNAKETFIEFIKFVLVRFITFFLDLFGVILLVEYAGFKEIIAKVTIVGLVVILNYIFSKFLVFGDTDDSKD